MPQNQAQQQAFDTIRSWVNQAQPQQQDQTHPNHLLQILTMLAQGADAMNTSNFLKKPGTFETDPLLKPFAVPGNPIPMLSAFGMEDKAISGLPSGGSQNTANALQLLLNILGIVRTNHAH